MTRVLLAVWLSVAPGQGADVTVDATLDRSNVPVGETVRLLVTVRGSSFRTPEIELPELNGFEVLGTSDRSSFRFSTAAGTVREFTREYTLRVEGTGSLTIPPIRVSVSGRLLETEALSLQAVADRDPGLPESQSAAVREEVALRLWAEPETAYVGQQVTLTVAAFFDPLVRSRLQRQPEYRAPDVQGVWTADLPAPPRPERRVVEGREYYVQVYRRALFPLSPGRLRIPSASVVYEIRRGLIYAPETFQVESGPAAVTILPLPSEGRPEGFGGAVGLYTARAEVDRPSLNVGEALNLMLEVEGTGNVSSLGRPALPEMSGFRVYDGGEDAEVQIRGTELAGRKRFSWVLVPEEPGDYVIPGLGMTYYDPGEAAYRTAATEPIAVQVERASSGYTGRIAEDRTIRYVKNRTGPRPAGLFRSPVFWALQAIPLVLLLGAWTARRVRGPVSGLWSQFGARARARRGRLRELRTLAESGEPSYFGRLRETVLSWLRERLKLSDPSHAELARLERVMGEAGVSSATIRELREWLARCDGLRYRPEAPDASERLELLEQADQLIARIDREALPARRLGRFGSVGTVGLLMLVGLGVGQPADMGPNGAVPPFEDGVAAYARGDYGAALEAFERAVVERPGDAHALYNLGNTHFEVGEVGHAVAYWVRASRIAPRDADVRYNLRFVRGDDPVIAAALPTVPLSEDELALAFALFWYLGCGLLLAKTVWPARPFGLLSSFPLLAALAALALVLAPRPDIAVLTDPEAVLRAGPVRQSEALATPAPGTGYRVVEVRNEWLRVTRNGNAEGWIEREDVEVIGRTEAADRAYLARLTARIESR